VRLALGSGNLLSTTTVDSNLLLIAEQVGTTSLLVWTRDKVYSYQVNIVPKDLMTVRAKVDALTKGLSGITVEQVGTELVLSGMVHKEVYGQLAAGLKGLPGVIFNIREDQGSAYTRSVLFRVHFIEVKRSLLENIGINWSKDTNGPVFSVMGIGARQGVYQDVPRRLEPGDTLLGNAPPFVHRGTNSGGVFLGLATTLTSRINLGINNGDVRVLASPELTAKSGGTARLQVGGEVPIQQAGALGATSITYKPYGIILEIEPQIDANNVITAKISSELSQIDTSVSTSSVPGFLTRKTATEVSVRSGETVALSGLVNSEMSSAVDRLPVLGKIPILGRLFRSDDFRSNKTELVVLLEPEIIEPGQGLAMQLRERGEAAKKEVENKVRQQ
jgi:pilus assembly protein CpaC